MGFELLTSSEMKRAEQLAGDAGLSGAVLMERAGYAVARSVQSLVQTGGNILVVCGPGNNGGDGFVAGQILSDRGYNVELVFLGFLENLVGEALSAALSWQGPIVSAEQANILDTDIVVDGLFGSGLSRDIVGENRILIERINASGKRVVAIDVPSGVVSDTGQVRGISIRATRTVTFFRQRPGHFLYPGKVQCGDIEVADIGISDTCLSLINPKTSLNMPELWPNALLPPREDGHKYSRGHLVVVSGGIENTGAARLAADAALRVGAGLVTVASPSDALAINAAALTDVMVRRSDGVDGLVALIGDQRRNAFVIGPGNGVGSVTRGRVRVALEAQRALVLDADALTSFEGRLDELSGLIDEQHQNLVVATPHEGEFVRLFRSKTEIISLDSRIERVSAAASFLGIVFVLKGPDTLVAAPDGRVVINTNGTPWLATAGSGDVLSGIIGGLLAQRCDAFTAASAGVWLHAEAGRQIGPGLAARDLADGLKQILGRLQSV